MMQFLFNFLNHSGAESGTVWENKVNTMVADALAPFVTWTSAAMVLTMRGK